MKTYIILSVLMLLVLSHCQVAENARNLELTDENVSRYLRAYKALRESAPGMLEELNQQGETPDAGQKQFANAESMITGAGLKDYPEFVILNAKIGAVFSIMQATKGMDRFKNLQESSNRMMDSGMEEIQKQLDNPDVPEETKVELRKMLEELQAGQQQLNQEYDKNKNWADFVMKKAKKITGTIVSDKDIEVVKRHEKEIMEAYVGFPLPYQNDGNMPEVDFSFDTE